MSKEPILCGFCGRECKESEDIGFIRFPDDRMKAVHLSHTGVKKEWESQDKTTLK